MPGLRQGQVSEPEEAEVPADQEHGGGHQVRGGEEAGPIKRFINAYREKLRLRLNLTHDLKD